MNRSRSILATVTLSLGLGVVAVACSSAPEDTGTSLGEELVTEHCPAGQMPSCKGSVCTCVPQGPQCTLGSPQLPYDPYVAAVAVLPLNGECPNIPASDGVWAQIGTTPPNFSPLPATSNGVPNDPEQHVPSCTEVYTQQCFSTCCTYVWWPTGFPGGPGQHVQNMAALSSGVRTPGSMVSLYGGTWLKCDPNDAGKCKGGDDCSTCEGFIQ